MVHGAARRPTNTREGAALTRGNLDLTPAVVAEADQRRAEMLDALRTSTSFCATWMGDDDIATHYGYGDKGEVSRAVMAYALLQTWDDVKTACDLDDYQVAQLLIHLQNKEKENE